MKLILSTSLLSLAVLVQACGKKDVKKTVSSIAADYQNEFGSQMTGEAVSAASAGDSEGSGGFSLALAGSTTPFKSVTRTCAVQADGSALVTITSDIDVDKSSSNSNMTRSLKISGTSTETRSWTHPSGVQCASSERAKVNLKTDAASYGLKVNVELKTANGLTDQSQTKFDSVLIPELLNEGRANHFSCFVF